MLIKTKQIAKKTIEIGQKNIIQTVSKKYIYIIKTFNVKYITGFHWSKYDGKIMI